MKCSHYNNTPCEWITLDIKNCCWILPQVIRGQHLKMIIFPDKHSMRKCKPWSILHH